MKFLHRFFLLIFILISLPELLNADINIKNALVKIYSVYNSYNYYEPWQMRGQRSATGSGCIIKGNRILTNAHIVSNHIFIQVKRAGQAKKYIARVDKIAHEIDLAVLTVIDESFFKGTVQLEIGDLPFVRNKVAVYGFPSGGSELSITEGVVSRIEHRKYSHSNAYLLACQIDAAINPGNSGGPVIKNDRIVGVAFQTYSSGENIGYMVPAPIIKHFLKDISDGTYNGIPSIGIASQAMENIDIRRKYGMDKDQTGVLIKDILYLSSAKGYLRKEDIILSIDEINVENDGSIEFRKGERTSMNYIIQQKFINDILKLKILRQKKVQNVTIKLISSPHFYRLVPFQQYEKEPTYYIKGGLLFEPLTRNLLEEWGSKWYYKAPANLLYHYYYGKQSARRKEIIVLVKVLADEINVGYHGWSNRVITKINGKSISSMRDVVKVFENYQGEYYTIVDDRGYKIVLHREKIEKSNQRILNRYKISRDRSMDLFVK